MNKDSSLISYTPTEEEVLIMRNLGYICTVIEIMARKTKNRNMDIVNNMKRSNLIELTDDIEFYVSDQEMGGLDGIADIFLKSDNIKKGEFDIMKDVTKWCDRIPEPEDMGTKYGNLVFDTLEVGESLLDGIIRVYNNPICEWIDDYKLACFLEPRDNTKLAYELGHFD